MKLYEFPPTRSQRAKWVLEELGLDYESETVDLWRKRQDSATYRTIHPLGVVPALTTAGYTIFESVAIVLQLIDEHPEAELAPPAGTASRASYYQWCVFAASELDPAIMMVFDNTLRPPEGIRFPEDVHDPKLAARGQRDFDLRAHALSSVLQKQPYLLGSRFSGADILVGHSCFMASVTGLINKHPTLERYYGYLKQRAAFQRAYPPDAS